MLFRSRGVASRERNGRRGGWEQQDESVWSFYVICECAESVAREWGEEETPTRLKKKQGNAPVASPSSSSAVPIVSRSPRVHVQSVER